MKKITNNAFALIVVANILVSSTGIVFAQSYDDLSDSFWTGGGSVSNEVSNSGVDYVPYDLNSSGNYSDLNNTFYSDATTFFGSTNCSGCGTSSGVDYVPYDLNSSGNYNNLNNTYFSDATTFYGSTDCSGCGTTYTTPTTYASAPVVYSTPSYGYTGSTGYTSSIGYTGSTYYPAPVIQYTNTTVPTNPVVPTPTTNRCSYTQDSYTSSYTNNYPTCTKVCTNGSTVAGNTTCPAPTPTPAQNCTYTQDSYTSSYTNNYPTCTKVCTNGLVVAGNTTCSAPNIVNPTPVVYCSNGQAVTYAYQCPSVYVPPTPVIQYTYTCPNGQIVSYSYQCPQVVTPVVPQTYPAAQVIKFNNVVTSVPTQITKTSARCNGIGLIAQGAASNGWFEYGETANLGRVTATASIGNAATAPFGNVLANLKPSTTYYCRAVMQNQYGTVKGETVKFTTKGTEVAYIKTTPKPAVKKTETVVKKTNIVTCSDGSSFTVGSTATAAIINNGQDLVSLSVAKMAGDLVENKSVTYQVLYKNLSDTTLTNVTVRVIVPQDISVTSVSSGSYDTMSHTLTLSLGTLAAYQEGTAIWTGKVAKNAQVGKSIVTTAYLAYTIIDANGHPAQDETNAYVVDMIGSNETISTGAQHVIGGVDSGRGFLPQSLVEWLALIAILFIIFILVRSVAASYKGEKDAHH